MGEHFVTGLWQFGYNWPDPIHANGRKPLGGQAAS